MIFTNRKIFESCLFFSQKDGEPEIDLFRAIFRNTDSEDSSSSEEEEAANAKESSLKVQVDAAPEQPRNDVKMDTSHIEEVSNQKGTCLS